MLVWRDLHPAQELAPYEVVSLWSIWPDAEPKRAQVLPVRVDHRTDPRLPQGANRLAGRRP